MKIPSHKIEEIVSKVDILEVIGAYVSLKANGDRYWGLCPFHGEKTPSFTVTPDKKLFYCFGCKETGGVFTFLQKIEHLSFVEAVEKLAQKAGVELNPEAETPEDRMKQALGELLSKVAKSFQFFLQENKDGARALEVLKKRQVSPEMIQNFQLGYAPADRKWLYQFLRKKNYSPEILAYSGLFSKNFPEITLFSDRLMFPISGPQGKVIGFGGRLLLGEGPKYINSPDTPLFHKSQNLYGYSQALPEIRKQRAVYLCEGYMDVIAMHQAGLTNTVAPLGTAFTEEQAKLLKKTCQTLHLLLDSDSAGQKATLKAIELGEKLEFDIRVHHLTGAKDPSEFLETQGSEALIEALKTDQLAFDFFLNFYYDNTRPQSPGALDTFLQNLFLFLDAVPSSVRKETYLGMASKHLGIPKEALGADYKKKGTKIPLNHRPPEEKKPPVLRGKPTLELLVLIAVLNDPALFQMVRRELIREDFIDPRAQKLFLALEQAQDAGEQSLEAVEARLGDPELQKELFERLGALSIQGTQEKYVSDGILRIKRRNLEKKRNDVVQDLNSQQSSPENRDRILDLLREKQYLDTEIQKIRVVYHE